MNLFPGREYNPDWNDPDIRSINAVSANGCLIPFPTYKKCFDAVSDYRRYLSDYIFMLNDSWEITSYQRIYDLPEKIGSSHYASNKINFPYVQNNANANIVRLTPPYADEHQEVTLLARTCSLPHYWSTLRKKITFAGVSCAFHIFINGSPAGYSDIRNSPVSFDITSLWQESENEIILLMYSSTSSDHLRSGWVNHFTGFVSDIYIEAFPAISLTNIDYLCKSNNADHTNWSIDIEAEISSCRISLDSPVIRFGINNDYKLLDSAEFSATLQPITENNRPYDAIKTRSKISCSFTLENIKSWSADQPVTYDLYITILDNRGYEQVCYHLPLGFREIVRRGRGFLLNGKPLTLTTVYTSIQAELLQPDSGSYTSLCKYSTTAERISSILVKAKKTGCNCIFLADGIVDPVIFELADMLGLFIIVSTDIYPDDHSLAELIGKWPIKNNPDYWTNIISATAADIIDVAKTHCSVIAYNIGTNLNKWPQLDKLVKNCTDIDSSRLILIPACDGTEREHPSFYLTSAGLKAVLLNQIAQFDNYKDLNLPLLLASSEINQIVPDNSDALYLLKTDKLPIFGIFLFEQVKKHVETSEKYNNTASLLNLYAMVDTEQESIIISNLHPFAGISNVNIDWQSQNGQNWLTENLIEADLINAGEAKALKLVNIYENDCQPTHLNFKISWTDNSWPHQGQRRVVCFTLPWSETNHSLIEPPSGRYTPLSHGRVRLEKDRHLLLISGNRFWFIFNKITGNFESWRCGETELLSIIDYKTGAGPYWQVISSKPLSSHILKCSSYVDSISYDCDGTGAVIETKYVLSTDSSIRFTGTVRYEINQKGELKIATGIEYNSSSEFLAVNKTIDLEYVFNLSRHINQLQWYGYGPTGVDNKSGDKLLILPVIPHPNNWLRLHSELVSENEQSWNGAHWLYAANEQGLGLMIKSDSPFNFASSLMSADIDSTDNKQFFSRHYGRLRLEFARIDMQPDIEVTVSSDSATSAKNDRQKGQSINIIKRQYILQPSALNFI